VQAVEAVAADHGVLARPGERPVGARALAHVRLVADESVVAAVADEQSARSAEQVVAAVAAHEAVRPGATGDAVVAFASTDAVVAVSRVDLVVPALAARRRAGRCPPGRRPRRTPQHEGRLLSSGVAPHNNLP